MGLFGLRVISESGTVNLDVKALVKSLRTRLPYFEVYFRRFIWSRVHFPESEIRFLHELGGRPIDVAVDVGAALGHYAWVLNRKARRVIAFEPGQVHGDFLARGIGGTRIELVRKAAGKTAGVVPMYTPGDDENARASATLSTANPVVNSDDMRVSEVPVVVLDSFLANALAPGERLDLLKVDVEGFELEVFEGARQRIDADHPLVIAEIEARHNDRYADVFGLLRDLGYEVFVMRNGKIESFAGTDLPSIQRAEDLAIRIGPDYQPGKSDYINNFIFAHPESKLRINA